MVNEKVISIQKIQNDNIEVAVFNVLEAIEARELFSAGNLKVVIKPNLLKASEPERAVITHPSILRAVIKWLKQFDSLEIIVAESSGTTSPGATERAFRNSGFQDLCEEECVGWTPFEKTLIKTYDVPNPLVLEHINSSVLLEEADIIINLPKIKTHWQCALTCCIKNMFGTLILGNKPKTHAKFPRIKEFSAALADIYSVSQPELTIIDGYLCQEGEGPSKGDVVKLDTIIAGYDPVALDTTVCEIIKLPKSEVKYIEMAEKKNLGSSNLNEFRYIGDSIQDVSREFKRAKIRPISVPLPDWLADYLGDIIFRARVSFNKEKCKSCATCWNNCPVGAIIAPDKEKGEISPKWDLKQCIFCYCCSELCPHEAVNFNINYIRNFFFSKAGIIMIIFLLFLILFLLWLFL